ncbi:MAG: acyl-CoA dehydrogenase family protein [Candidatus Binatia bacterium]
MNFEFSPEQESLRQTARGFLEEHSSLRVCRAVIESGQPCAGDLWQRVAGLGWLGATIPVEYGGAGMSYLELAVLAEEMGRVLAPIPFSTSVYLVTEALLLAGSPEQQRKYLPRLAAGEAVGVLALAEGVGRSGTTNVSTRFVGGVLRGTKLPVLDGAAANFAVVSARGRKGVSLVIADLDAAGVEVEGLRSFDPSRSLAKLSFAAAPGEFLGGQGRGAAVLEQVLDRAAVLLAFEQLGGASRAFEITRAFTLERYAFGRPIASFQALKHRLVDAWALIELARSSCYYGAWALSTNNAELSAAASVARLAASEAFVRMAEEMMQMHGGVGYTWEYDCHLFYRRAKLLAAALGAPSSWKHKLIDRLRASRT